MDLSHDEAKEAPAATEAAGVKRQVDLESGAVTDVVDGGGGVPATPRRKRRKKEKPAECSTCCEEMNLSDRAPVECPKCSYLSCRSCVVRFITSSIEDATCMSCNQPFDRKLLASMMTKKFMAVDYMKHREDVLYQRERSKIPETVPLVAAVSRIKKMRQEMWAAKEEERRLRDEADKQDMVVSRLKYRIGREELFVATGGREGGPDSYRGGQTDVGEKVDDEGDKFTTRGHCPVPDCNGLIAEGWECVACQTKVCRACMVALPPPVEDDKSGARAPHVCKEEDLATVRAIRAECKPCPNCRVRIFRTAGCSQMWCTQCRTCFSWQTMKVIKGGFFHNPHYAEWQASRRTAGGRRADGCVTANVIYRMFYDRGLSREHSCTTLRQLVTSSYHENDVEGRVNRTTHDKYLRTLRMKFIMGDITEEEFRTKVQRADKRFHKKVEIAQVHDMYGNASRDIINEFSHSCDTVQNNELFLQLAHDCIQEVSALHKYANECIAGIFDRYGHHMKAESRADVKFAAVRHR